MGNNHTIVRTDLLAGTDVRSELVSVIYESDGVPSAIDNGRLVRLGNLIDRSRTVYIGVAPKSTDKLDNIVLIASPEKMYKSNRKGLRKFENKAGDISRGYRLHEHDIFSVTADAFSGTPSVGKMVSISDDTKMSVTDSDGFGTIIDKNNVCGNTFWVIQINAKPKDTPDPPPVEELSTTLFTDGTLVINEWKTKDREANIALHGIVTKEFPVIPDNEEYVPEWNEYQYTSVVCGSRVKPYGSMGYWFYSGDPYLTSVDLSNMDTSNVTSIEGLFEDNYELINANLSGWDLRNIRNDSQYDGNFNGVFMNCTRVEAINVSNWTNMNNIKYFCRVFSSCGELQTIDLSSWDTSNATDMTAMFDGCRNLQTIYVSSLFDTSKVTDSDEMFDMCTSLVGGAGTTYDSTKTDKTYARVDNPPDAPGYFTATN